MIVRIGAIQLQINKTLVNIGASKLSWACPQGPFVNFSRIHRFCFGLFFTFYGGYRELKKKDAGDDDKISSLHGSLIIIF